MNKIEKLFAQLFQDDLGGVYGYLDKQSGPLVCHVMFPLYLEEVNDGIFKMSTRVMPTTCLPVEFSS